MRRNYRLVVWVAIAILFGVVVVLNSEKIKDFSHSIVDTVPKNETLTNHNDYYRKNDYHFVQNKEDLLVTSYQEILNMYYTILDSGAKTGYFWCSKNYDNCLSDVNGIAKNETLLSDINNLVHPYNSFSDIKTRIHSDNKVTIEVNKNYSDEQINYVNARIKEIYDTKINKKAPIKNQIEAFHDYIINTTKYNDEVLESDEQVRGKNAYHLFQTGTSYCVGYSDTLAIFLDMIKVKNYKIASSKHIWNFVFLDDGNFHIDMTWDDPVTNTGEQLLKHDYFLITTQSLLGLDDKEHNYSNEVYFEAK